MNVQFPFCNRAAVAVLTTVTTVLALMTAAFSPRDAVNAETTSANSSLPQSPNLAFTESGELIRPEGYRHWLYVGAPLTPNDMNDGKAAFPEFHNVYINPEAFAVYERTGEFPDGTTLVKELVSVGSKAATSGKGYFMGEFIGLEVALKDSSRFKDEPGNWAYFSFGHEYPLEEQVAHQPVANCSTCHMASAAADFVFTQYYPVLRAAKQIEEDQK